MASKFADIGKSCFTFKIEPLVDELNGVSMSVKWPKVCRTVQ